MCLGGGRVEEQNEENKENLEEQIKEGGYYSMTADKLYHEHPENSSQKEEKNSEDNSRIYME